METILLSLLFLFSVATQQASCWIISNSLLPKVHHKNYGRFYISDSSEDPLDNIKEKKNVKKQFRNLDDANETRIISETIVPDTVYRATRITQMNEASSNDIPFILESMQSDLLEFIPSVIFDDYLGIAKQYSLRMSLIALAFHAMILPVIIPVLKNYFHISMSPFIFLGIFVFGAPFVALWWWESGNEVEFFDNKLMRFISQLRENSDDCLGSKESEILNKISSSESVTTLEDRNSLLNSIALWRLLSALDEDIMYEEVQRIKNSKGQRGSTKSMSTSKYTPNRELDTSAEKNGLVDDEKAAINAAVKQILDYASSKGETKEQTLEKLLEIQEQINSQSKSLES